MILCPMTLLFKWWFWSFIYYRKWGLLCRTNLLQIIWGQRLKILYKYGPYDMGPKININLNKNKIQLCALSLLNFCARSLCVFTLFVCALLLKRERARKKCKDTERAHIFSKKLLRGPYIMFGFSILWSFREWLWSDIEKFQVFSLLQFFEFL